MAIQRLDTRPSHQLFRNEAFNEVAEVTVSMCSNMCSKWDGTSSLVYWRSLQRRVGKELVQHIRLLIVVCRQRHVDHDVLDNLEKGVSCESMTLIEVATHVDLSTLVLLDLLGVPNLLVGTAGFQICVVLQSQLNHEIVIAQLHVLLSEVSTLDHE